MNVRQRIQLSIAPGRETFSAVIAFFSAHLEAWQKLDPTAGRVSLLHFRLALDEALLNASEHGCRQGTPAQITVELHSRGDVVELSVEDSGLGFSYQNMRITDEKNLEMIIERGMQKAKGWGLAIIQSFCHTMYWNPRGNRITMVFLGMQPNPAGKKG